ncbi:MAG: carbohydrate kinase family protein [Lachnospiraceae bacterium]|nr:carbohydrate kinase family protein [Lachnospiraceae bacterium]
MDITVIGAAIIDVMAGAVSSKVFETGSQPVQTTKLTFGGDGLNESVALSRLGKKVQFISKVGQDEAGSRVLDYARENGLCTDSIEVEEGLDTGINIVLVDEKGERFFLTNPNGSLRKLSKEDIEKHLDNAADIISFASIFVSPLLDIQAMEQIFKSIKSKPGRILVADMTKAKNGETIEDIKPLLPYIDYILPNEDEIALLTGEKDVYVNANLLVDAGVSCAVIKRGSKGCLIKTKSEMYEITAYPIKEPVDSTGAGDCFAAGFIWALSEHMSLEECGRFACATASCTVECVGATDGIRGIEQVMYRYNSFY